jgi:hypothetical protein
MDNKTFKSREYPSTKNGRSNLSGKGKMWKNVISYFLWKRSLKKNQTIRIKIYLFVTPLLIMLCWCTVDGQTIPDAKILGPKISFFHCFWFCCYSLKSIENGGSNKFGPVCLKVMQQKWPFDLFECRTCKTLTFINGKRRIRTYRFLNAEKL